MNEKVKAIRGIDGVLRGPRTESVINDIVLEVLGRNELGRKLFDYLRSITTESVLSGEALDPNRLMHLEGQRWLVGVLSQRIRAGERQRTKPATDEGDHE